MNPDHYITTKTGNIALFLKFITYCTIELLDYLGEFVEVVINMILYTREVYPPSKRDFETMRFTFLNLF